ncbi:Response regulator receiver domain-containing protein [Candidatus Electrothrix aarhusensis]|jgi:DNA-binding response OmpR family regulator|uniref:Response regulator receiver domain-containing protein n=1 Tax=Candidatus Electrothrix aarhusensis TaxID=1859131 RepID=A0A444IXX8_9BACT|nr:Response regulator receiver domain-containing protein [Candidatus Electrothrix aarhusensis]
MKVIFCEECGGKNIVADEQLEHIDNKPLGCQICGNIISQETIIPHLRSTEPINTLHYHLLLIDDDFAHLQLMKTTLEKEYTVSIASTGVHGLELAAERKPDLILLDLSMPGMDGYEVCKRLKENPVTRKITVIFVSARDDKDDEYRGFTLGAVDYINKPINLQILNARITAQLRLKQLIDQQKKQSDSLIHSLHQDNIQIEQELERLQQEKTNLFTLLDLVQDRVIIEDAETRILWANKATRDFCTLRLSELIGSLHHEVLLDSSFRCEECIDQKLADDTPRVNSLSDARWKNLHIPLFDENDEVKSFAHIIQEQGRRQMNEDSQICQAAESAVNSFVDKNRKAIRDNLATILFGIDAVGSLLRDNKDLETVSRPVTKAAEELDRMVCTLLDFQQTDKES